MRRLLLTLLLAGPIQAWPAEPQPASATPQAGAPAWPGATLPPLTTTQQVRNLTPAEAERGYPVHLKAVITYRDPSWSMLFVQDATGGIYVNAEGEWSEVKAGRWVEIKGFSAPGDFAPVIGRARLEVQGEGALPEPHRFTLTQLLTGREDSQWIEIEGVVRSMSNYVGHAILDITTPAGRFQATLPDFEHKPLPEHLIDAEVKLRGACATLFNQRRQIYGIQLCVPGLEHILVTRPPPEDPFSIPAQPIRQLLQFSPGSDPIHRIKVEGTVTLQRWESNVFVQDDTGGLFVESEKAPPLKPGDRVVVAGFPALGEYTPVLQQALVRFVGSGGPPVPARLVAEEALSDNFTNQVYDAALVRMDARFLEEYETFDDRVLVFQTGQFIFNAHLELEKSKTKSRALKKSSLVQLTGVCSVQVDESRHPRAFRILLRSPDDLVVLAQPPWWSLKHSLALAGSLIVLSGMALIWGAVLHREVRSQTSVIRRQIEQETILQKRFSDLVENAHDIVYVHDLSGQLTAFNRAGERILGQPAAQMIGRNIAELIAPDHLDRARTMTKRKVEGEPATTYELDVLASDGRRVPLEISSRPILENGRVVGIQGIARDISDRKRAEMRNAAFSSLGQRLSSANTAEAAARIIVEIADSLLSWDACSLDLYQTESDRMFTVLNIDVMNGQRTVAPPAYIDREPTPMARRIFEHGAELILRPATTQIPSHVIPFGDTARPSASLLYVPIRNGARVIGLLTIQSYTPNRYDADGLRTLQSLADLAAGALERVRAEMALKESEQWLKALFAASRDGIVVEENERIVYANQAFAGFYGYERPEELVGRHVSLVQAADDNQRLLDFGQRRLRGEPVPSVYAFRGRKKDGREIAGEASVSTAEIAGKTYIISMVRDVRERLEMEAQLCHAQKMESVGQLAAGVAHDFNNIMTIIQGHACLQLAKAGAEADLGLKRSLEQISEAADRAARLTRQLLTFSRKQTMRVQPLDINQVAGETMKMLGRILGEHITVCCQYSSRPLLIQADAAMVEQLITNLAVNARDAMPTGGTLGLRTDVVEIDAAYAGQHPDSRPGSFVCLTVFDTGHGMDAATLSHIFEPFFTTKDVGKGTGLGLATVYGIVKQHRGWIEVSSEVGQGTTFKVYFPPASQSAGESPEPFATPGTAALFGPESVSAKGRFSL